MEKYKFQANSFSNEVFIRNPREMVIFREHKMAKEKTEVDVQCNCWTLGWANIPKDRVFYQTGSTWTELSGSVFIYRAPFSVIHWRLKPGTLNWGFKVSYKDLSTAQKIPSQIISGSFFDIESDTILKSIAQKNGTIIDQSIIEDCVWDLKKSIDATFHSTVNIQDLLPKNRNYSYMSREFKKRYNVSPVKYRNTLRLMQAYQDLMFSGQSVETVYHQNGITDPKYFYSRFKKLFGALPAQFRRSKISDIQL